MDGIPRALITGASRGFGLALTRELLDAGWWVATISRTAPPEADRCATVIGDVADPRTADLASAALGGAPIDLLVNNAGIRGGGSELQTLDVADVEASFRTNVVGPLQITRAVRANLAGAGGALVVNVGSRLASMARQSVDHYDQDRLRISYGNRIAKAAQNMLGLCLAHELAPEGVAVWAMHPGRLTTAMGSREADTDPREAARAARRLIEERDPTDLRPRYLSLDPRECPDGGDIPW